MPTKITDQKLITRIAEKFGWEIGTMDRTSQYDQGYCYTCSRCGSEQYIDHRNYYPPVLCACGAIPMPTEIPSTDACLALLDVNKGVLLAWNKPHKVWLFYYGVDTVPQKAKSLQDLPRAILLAILEVE